MPTTVPPDAAVLRQFRLGLLAPERAAAVEKWLTETPGAADELSRVVARDPVTDALCETLTAPPADNSVVPLALSAIAADVPTAVGEFRVVRELGRGGMGVVLEAEDTRLGRRVAVKLIGAGVAADGTARVRFQHEARAVAGIEHDNVVPVHQVGEDGGRLFLVMPLLKGETLYARLRRDGRLTVAEVKRIGRDVALGLAAAHAVGLIHRDVKPANVWLDADTGRARLLDFGLAKPLEPADDDGPRTQAGAVIGTPHYMAPEQAEGKPVDHRADLFSLGALLYHAATGERPFGGDTMWQVLHAVTAGTPAPPEALTPDLPPHLARLIRELLAKSPADRPASAAAVAEALARPDNLPMPWDALGDATEVLSAPPGRRPQTHPQRRATWQAFTAAVALVVALAGALAVYQIEFKVKDGTLVVEVDGEVDARFKGGELQIFDAAGKLKYTLKPGQRDAKLPAGAYAVRVRGADGIELDTPAFTMTKDGRVVVRVTAKAAPIENQKPSGIDAATDRRAALWVFSVGGTVQVDDWGYWINAADLPIGPFRLTGINLHRSERVTDDGLANLANCRHLAHLDLDGETVGDRGAAHLRNLPMLSYLHLGHARLTGRGFAEVARLPRLTSLLVTGDGVTDEVLAAFKGRTNLVRLDLSGTKVSDAGLAHFAGCKGLLRLGLNRTSVTDVGLEPFGACDDLEQLHLERTRVTDAGLARFRNCRRLKAVSIDGTGVTDAGLAHLRGCERLITLYLSNTGVSDAGLAHFKNCTNLEWLELDATPVTDKGIAFLSGCRRLVAVYLRGTKVTRPAVTALHKARPHVWIEWAGGTLNAPTAADRKAAEAVISAGGTVRGNIHTRDVRAAADLTERLDVLGVQLRNEPKVTDAWLAVLAECRYVSHVDLSGTAVGDAGLAAFKNCRPLLTLDLGRTRVTAAGLTALDGFTDLTHVRLNDTALDDAGLARLAECTDLVYLDLRQTKVTAAAVAAFAAARPRCRIEWDGGIIGPNR